ncbi:MAG: PAS domain-containing protein, partial [Promethearchaeota archaeon]
SIFFKDLESRYIIANDKTLEAFGLSKEQVIGKNDYEIMRDKEEALKNIEDDREIYATKKTKKAVKQITRTDGNKYWFQSIKVPQFDDKGNIIGIVGISRDITERKKAEDELRKDRDDITFS